MFKFVNTSPKSDIKQGTTTCNETEVMSLYPTLDSIDDVIALAKELLPDSDHNAIYALLATQHNTTIGLNQ